MRDYEKCTRYNGGCVCHMSYCQTLECPMNINHISEERTPEMTDKEIWDKTDNETKLAITSYIMGKICENAHQCGSYRKLIYDHLGFGKDAYSYLYPHGQNITNNLRLPK